MRPIKIILALALVLVLTRVTAQAQGPDAVADLAARINHERVTRGLTPFALNADLTKAAQAHADDMARSGNYSHAGSDGSTVFDRVQRSGFGAFSWGLRVGENWAWFRDAAAAMSFWMNSEPHRNNILHPLYREFGIGIAPTKPTNTLFVVDFGAEPNVLPVFIDGTAATTREISVTLTLSSENVMPSGDGPKTIGQPTQMLISNLKDFAGAEWRPFSPSIPWLLEPGGGTKTVYVKYRDASGRTATASNEIAFDAAVFEEAATPRPKPTATPRPKPSVTRTPQPSVTATVIPSATATQAASPTVTETATLTLTETSTPTVTLTPTFALTATWTALSDASDPAASPASETVVAQTTLSFDPKLLGTVGLVFVLSALAAVKYIATRRDR
ncbi:MAG: CAP domain-containing protein [Chloroflexi bacterium]|nr:CAP domain-containing protein [Chloroflexota bacterium]